MKNWGGIFAFFGFRLPHAIKVWAFNCVVLTSVICLGYLFVALFYHLDFGNSGFLCDLPITWLDGMLWCLIISSVISAFYFWLCSYEFEYDEDHTLEIREQMRRELYEHVSKMSGYYTVAKRKSMVKKMKEKWLSDKHLSERLRELLINEPLFEAEIDKNKFFARNML